MTFCCDRHDDDVFDLNEFLPSPLYTDVPSTIGTKRKEPPTPRVKKRVVKEREALDHRLIQWLTTASQNDHLRGVQAAVDILSDRNRAILVCTHPALLASPNAITKLLDETEEWQEEWSTLVFDVIRQYDKDIAASGVTNRESKSGPAQKRVKITR
jgi:hypothetical protein